jgi:hypothetical protein
VNKQKLQWRIQKISEGMAVYRKGWRSWSKYSFQSLFEAVQPFCSVSAEKKCKKIHEGTAVTDSPNSWIRQ